MAGKLTKEQRINRVGNDLIAELHAERAKRGGLTDDDVIVFLTRAAVAARLSGEDTYEALRLCCESRNRLTTFKADPLFWVQEARRGLEDGAVGLTKVKSKG